MPLGSDFVETVGIKPTTDALQVLLACLGTFAPILSGRWDSNPRPKDWKSFILITELLPQFAVRTGLEPVTPCVTGMYSSQTELPHQILSPFSICQRTLQTKSLFCLACCGYEGSRTLSKPDRQSGTPAVMRRIHFCMLKNV